MALTRGEIRKIVEEEEIRKLIREGRWEDDPRSKLESEQPLYDKFKRFVGESIYWTGLLIVFLCGAGFVNIAFGRVDISEDLSVIASDEVIETWFTILQMCLLLILVGSNMMGFGRRLFRETGGGKPSD